MAMATTQTKEQNTLFTLNDIRQDPAYAVYMASLGWKVFAWKYVGSYYHLLLKQLPLLPLYLFKVQRVPIQAIDWKLVDGVCRDYRVLAGYIEPLDGDNSDALIQRGYKAEQPMLASRTLFIDLTQPLPSIRSKMKAKTRYNLGLSERKGLITDVVMGSELRQSQRIWREFYALVRGNNTRLKLFPVAEKDIFSLIHNFDNKSMIVMIRKKNGEILAGAAFLATQNGIYYSHNASTSEGRKLMAPTLAVWEGIKLGKKKGCRYLDFDGIDDPRYPKSAWRGFSRFKLGFGGITHCFPPLYKRWWPRIDK